METRHPLDEGATWNEAPILNTDTDAERVIDARVQRALATDKAYRNAENAEEQQNREDEITAQVEAAYYAGRL
jgi:hypothetical protein